MGNFMNIKIGLVNGQILLCKDQKFELPLTDLEEELFATCADKIVFRREKYEKVYDCEDIDNKAPNMMNDFELENYLRRELHYRLILLD